MVGHREDLPTNIPSDKKIAFIDLNAEKIRSRFPSCFEENFWDAEE
jgi:hypothetical protein